MGFALFFYLFLFNRTQSKQIKRLEEEGILDTAIIIKQFIGTKRKLFFEYIFYVGNKQYNGFLHYSPSNGPINIGDSCLMKYLPTDPANYNQLLKNKYTIVKIQQNTNTNSIKK